MFTAVAIAVFLLVAFMHFYRISKDIDVALNGSNFIPMWVSWIGMFVAIGMAVWGICSFK